MFNMEQIEPSKSSASTVISWVSFIVAVLVLSTLGARNLGARLGLSPGFSIVVVGILPAVISILLVAAIESRLSKQSLGHSLEALGLGKLHPLQLAAAFLATAPLWIAYVAIFQFLKVSSTPAPQWPLLIIKFIVSQGIAEEVVFRGFVFRRLSVGRSFTSAATISAVVFSLIHLVGLIHGFSHEVLIGVAVSVTFSFLLAYPLAYLFHHGRGVIWGPALWHVSIDSINWFPKVAEPGPAWGIYFAGILCAIGAVFVFGRLFLRNKHVR